MILQTKILKLSVVTLSLIFDLTSSNGSTGLSRGRNPVLMTYTMATQSFILSLYFMINKQIFKF